MKKIAIMAWVLLAVWSAGLLPAQAGFKAIGPFSFESRDDGSFVAIDGIGRRIYLLPRGRKAPPGVRPTEIVRIPVRSVATDSWRDTSLFLALGVIGTVKAVSGKPDDWVIPQIQNGLKKGSIVSLGRRHGLDFERLAELKPELFFTWDESLVPMMDELGITTVIVNSETARDLDTQIRFIDFLAIFFGKQKEADEYVARTYAALKAIKAKIKGVKKRPKVIWGDIYSKRVLVEPGNSWAAQIVEAAGGDYLFSDVSGDT